MARENPNLAGDVKARVNAIQANKAEIENESCKPVKCERSHLIQLRGSLLISDLPSWIFAVVRLVERRANNFLSPDLLSSSLWTSSEVFVSFIEIPINRQHAFFCRLVIAIVDCCPGHAAEHRLNYVQKLCR
jgi:hypothetical protein